MYHFVMSASTDGRALTAHLTCREMQSDHKWHTIATTGVVRPLITGGLFGDEREDLEQAIIALLPDLIAGLRNTRQ